MRTALALLFAASLAVAQPRFDLPVSWLAPGPDSSRTVYAYANGALFRTTDLGQTWVALSIRPSGSPQPELSGLLVTPSSPLVVYALGRGRDGAVWKSTDAGQSWRPAGLDLPNSPDFAEDAFIDLADPNLIYLRLGTQVFKSTNGGLGWNRISTLFAAGPYLAFAGSPSNRRTVYYANSGTVFRSSNEGATWTPSFTAPGSRPLRAVAADRLNSDFVLTHYFGDVDGIRLSEAVRTSDAGINWTPLAPPGDLRRLIVATGNIYYGLAVDGAFVRSTNAANSWNRTAAGFASAIAADPLDPTIVFAAANGVSRSANSGATFTPLGGIARPNFARPTPVSFRIRSGDSASIRIPVAAFENPQWAIQFEASVSEPWLRWSAPAGTTPATLALSIDTAGLAPGMYTALASLQSPQAAATLAIPVTISVDPIGPSSPQFSLSSFSSLDGAAAIALDSAGNALASNPAGIFRLDRSAPAARIAALPSVSGIASAPDDSIYIARSAPPSIQRFAAGSLSTLFTEADARSAGAPSFAPQRIRRELGNRFLIAAGAALLRFEASSNLPIGLLAVAPPQAFFADAVADPAGNLWIADSARHLILRLDPASGQLTTVAGRPGVAGFAGDSGPAADALFNTPRALARDASGTLYIADSANSRIRAITPDGRIFSLASQGLTAPSDLALDAQGNLLAADAPGNRIVLLTALRNLPEITSGGFVNAAGNRPFLSPGGLFTLYGSNLSVNLDAASGGPLPTLLGGSSVTIGGVPAPLFFVSGNQINGQVPVTANPGLAAAVVTSGSLTSSPVTAPILSAAPGIFLYGEDRAAAVNPSGAVNAPSAPAAPGDVLVVFLSGIGPLDNPVAAGSPAPASPLARATAPRRATLAGRDCEVQFLGLAPGFVGLAQANIRIPSGTPAGDQTLVISVNGVESNPALVAIR